MSWAPLKPGTLSTGVCRAYVHVSSPDKTRDRARGTCTPNTAKDVTPRAFETNRCLIGHARGDDGCVPSSYLIKLGSEGGHAVKRLQVLLAGEPIDVLDMVNKNLVDVILPDTVLRQECGAAFAVKDHAMPFWEVVEFWRKFDLFDDGAVGLKKGGSFGQGFLGARAGKGPHDCLANGETRTFDAFEHGCMLLCLVILDAENISQERKVIDTPSKPPQCVKGQGVDLGPLAGDRVPRGLEPVDAVERGRPDHGAAGLGTQGEGSLEVGDDGAGAGRRSAGGAERIVGVAGLGTDVDGSELGGCRLAWGWDCKWESRVDGESELPKMRAPA